MKCQLCSLGLLFAASSASLAVTPPPEKLLAADTVAVLTIPDYVKASASWKQWPSSLLWADASMKPFKDKFLAKLRAEVVVPLEKEFGIKFGDYAGLAQGQLTLALTPNGWEGNSPKEPGFLFLLDSRDKSGALKTNLAELKNKWVDSGKQVRLEKIRDVEFTTLIFKADDLKKTLSKLFPDPNGNSEALEPPKPDKPGKEMEFLVGQSDSLLVIGSSAKDIEKVLINQAGGAVATLSDQSSFASSYGSLFRDSQVYGWVNANSIIAAVTRVFSRQAEAQPQGRQQTGPKPDKILSAIGLSGLQTVAFNLRDSGEGCAVNLNLNVPEASRRGIFKVVSYDAKDASPPPFVPADAVKFSRWRLDLPKAWATLESTLTEAIPQAASFVKLIVDSAGKDRDPNFDLRKNLIANLGDDIVSYAKTLRKQTLADLGSPPSLILINSARPEQVASAIKALGAVMPQPKVKEREFLGRTVYALNLPPSQAPGGKPIDRVLHYTASGGYVAMSTDVAMLEEFMRNGESAAKALRDTPGLREAAQKVGGMSTGLFGYENQAETMRAIIETLKKESGTLANLFSGSPLASRFGMGEDANKFKEWVDFSLLPSFDKIAKYFYINVWSGSTTPEGLSFKVYAPSPPQMKK
ncbi:MAG TPA: hypothetical protein VEO53_13815 [Candidatus Binatia bacterium]|nr:hypothetical protein [Candidatus Binatia bacterium]